MNKIIGFFHIGVLGRWFEIYQSQLRYLKQSGLYDKTEKIYIGIAGQDVRHMLSLDPKMEIICIENRLNYGETTTIRELYKYCVRTNEKIKLWYIHTKGAKYTMECNPDKIELIDSWRNYLEYFVIGNHEKCAKPLDEYDACGTEYCENNYFSGNFWWATSDYIRRINLKGLWLNGSTLGMWKSYRHLAERSFVGTGNPKIFNFITVHKRGIDAYYNKVSPDQYKKLF